MEASPPPPEGALLHRARESAEITIADAARAAGITDTRWSQIERGHERRKGMDVPARAKAGTLARMARAIGVSPERLESEGRRPDAAEILREILRTEPAPVRRNPFAFAANWGDEPQDDDAWKMFPDPADRLFRMIWRRPIPEKVRVRKVGELRAAIRRALDPPGEESTGLNVPDCKDLVT
jgi:transcriptional regulator with XRE-family HTH domain